MTPTPNDRRQLLSSGSTKYTVTRYHAHRHHGHRRGRRLFRRLAGEIAERMSRSLRGGEHLRAIREQGLRIESVFGDFTLFPAQATDDPATVGPVDVVIFATKTHQIEAAAEAMRPMIGAHTAVLPLHNGLDASERTAAVLGRGRCWAASARWAARAQHLGHPADDAVPSRGGRRARWPDHATRGTHRRSAAQG